MEIRKVSVVINEFPN